MYLIGDSQVRSFSQFNEVVSLFLGPAKLNNLNDDKKAEKTKEKIIDSFKHISNDNRVIYLIGSGYRYSKAFDKNKNSEIIDLAKCYLKHVLDLSSLLDVDFTIAGPVPPTIYGGVDFDAWELFNKTLRDLIKSSELKFIDFADIMSSDSPLSEIEIFDETHISTTFAGKLLEIIADRKIISFGCDTYEEEIKLSKSGTVKVVGDLNINDLSINIYDTLCFNLLNRNNKVKDRLITVLKTEIENHSSVSCIEDGSGFIGREIKRLKKNSCVKMVLRNQISKNRATCLNALFGVKCNIVEFGFFINDHSDLNDILIVDGFEKIRDEFKDSLIKLFDNYKKIIVISRQPLKDRKMLEKYKYLISFEKTGGPHGFGDKVVYNVMKNKKYSWWNFR